MYCFRGDVTPLMRMLILYFHNSVRKYTGNGLTLGRDGYLPEAYEIPELVIFEH